MFIDIHAHAYWEPVPFVARFATPEHLIQVYDEYGIEKGVLLPVVNSEIYFPQSNEDILNMAEKYPDRFIPYCNVDPRAVANSPKAPLEDVLQYYKDRGCKGLGEVMPNLEVMDPLVQNLFRAAEKVGLPVVFDGSDQKTNDFGLYDDPGLPQLEHTLHRYPELKIFGHGPVFWAEIAKLETPGERAFIMQPTGEQVGILPNTKIVEEGVVPKLFRRYKNLYGDLSDFTCYNALTRDEEYGPKFLEEFQDRMFFGTDYCSCGMDLPLTRKLIEWRDNGKLSVTAFNKIARENAIKLLGL
ncbi:MAG: amidohydrolase [Ruminococcaceae bacterium]|nr:amidohydrolase [Oscillospiraceae bacterium]